MPGALPKAADHSEPEPGRSIPLFIPPSISPSIGPSIASSIGPSIDLQRLLIRDPVHTVLLRVWGDSMVGAGIQHGDLVVVERHRSPRSGQLVVALLGDGFTLKRLVRRQERWLLEAAHPAYPALELGEGRIWGVAIHAIRQLAR